MYITIAVLVAVALIGYFYWRGSQSSPDVSALSEVSNEQQLIGAKVLSLLGEINSLKIDASLFSSPVYKTLRDYSVDIPILPVGRDNPFAPVPGVPNPSGEAENR